MSKVKCIIITTSCVVIQRLLFTLKETLVITTDEVEEWVDTEEETDPTVQQVGEIFTCSTMAVCNES